VVWQQRLARSLSRPRTDDDSARSRLRRSASFGRHHNDADIDVRTADHRHRTSSSYIDLTRDTHDLAAHRTRSPYAVGTSQVHAIAARNSACNCVIQRRRTSPQAGDVRRRMAPYGTVLIHTLNKPEASGMTRRKRRYAPQKSRHD